MFKRTIKNNIGLILIVGSLAFLGYSQLNPSHSKIFADSDKKLVSIETKSPEQDLTVSKVQKPTPQQLKTVTEPVKQVSKTVNSGTDEMLETAKQIKLVITYPLRMALGFLTNVTNSIQSSTNISMSVVAYADSEDNMSNPELQLGSTSGISYFISKVNTYTSSKITDIDSSSQYFSMFSTKNIGDSPVLYMNKKGYDKQTVKVKQAILSQVYKCLDDSEVTSRDKNRIYNWIEGIDQVNSTVVKEFSSSTSTDLYGAQKILLPFQSKMGIVLGVIALVIALTLTFSFVWDMAFLSIPFFTVLLTRNGSVDMTNRPFLVSQDAVLAYLESNANNKQALTVWFKYRMKSSIIIGLCLTYLISNQIWQLVSFLVDVISRFIT